MKFDILPNAHGDQLGSPVPGVLIASFSGLPIVKADSILTLPLGIMLLGRLKSNLKNIVASREQFFNSGRVLPESIICYNHLNSIDRDIGVGVQSMENYLDSFVQLLLGNGNYFGVVHPTQRHPVHSQIVVSVERIL